MAEFKPMSDCSNDNKVRYQGAYPEVNQVDLFRAIIADELGKISGIDSQQIFDSISWTNTLDKGDLLIAVPRFRIKDKQPMVLAKEWAEKFPARPELRAPLAVGINVRFDFSPSTLSHVVLKHIFELGGKYGSNPCHGLRDSQNSPAERKKVVIEFSSPNIAKKFHVGHLRSTIIGGFLSNLFRDAGWNVVRLNYLGDWGRQYGLLAIAWEQYGDEEDFLRDPIKHLYNIYVKISAEFKPEEDAYKAARDRGESTAVLESQGLLGSAKRYFARMEQGDEVALSLWRRFRTVSIAQYRNTYARLNVEFDEYSGESQVLKTSMEQAEKVMRDRGISHFDDGAWVVDFRRFGAKHLEAAIIRNRNGTSNYLLRDVGAAIQRNQTHKMDKMIYVVMSEQDLHLRRLFKILELMGGDYMELSKKLQHVTFGKVLGMSTRRGNVMILDDVLTDIGDAMHEVMRQNGNRYRQIENPSRVADTLGISAIMVQDMAGKRINNYTFDMNRMLSFEGDTGPYLQYAHARLCSLERKAGFSREQMSQADFNLLQESHATDLLRSMAQFPDVVGQTYKTLEPTTVLTFLFKLTHQVSSSYDVLRVLNAPEGPEVALARAALYHGARQVLANGMALLGLAPVERM